MHEFFSMISLLLVEIFWLFDKHYDGLENHLLHKSNRRFIFSKNELSSPNFMDNGLRKIEQKQNIFRIWNRFYWWFLFENCTSIREVIILTSKRFRASFQIFARNLFMNKRCQNLYRWFSVTKDLVYNF